MILSAPSAQGALLQVVASLMWLPQAAAIAYAVQNLGSLGVQGVLLPASVVLVCGAVRALCDAAGSRMCYAQAQRTVTARRSEAVKALMRRSPLDAGRLSSGAAASLVAEQTQSLTPYLARFAPARLKAMVVPLVILAAVLPFSWVAACILLFALPPIPLFAILIGWTTKAASVRQLGKMGTLNGFLLDRLRGLATIRALGAVEQTAQRLRGTAEDLRAKTMAVLRIAFLTSAMLELFAALGVALMAVYIGFHLLGQINFGAWGNTLTLGEGLFILLLAPAFFEPMRELSAVWHDRTAGKAAEEALEALGDGGMPMVGADVESPLSPPAERGGATGTAESGGVRLKDVSFAQEGVKVLDGFDLDVRAGEHVALFGPSGSGKTTILSLIAGLAPCDGRIEIGSVRMEAETAEALRGRMAWLGQKPHFQAGSVRANLGDVCADDVRRVLGQVGLGPVPPDRQIGENGAGLSGGEALRLALARIAVQAEASIILADEPTTHLDRGTARQIAGHLLELAQGKTLIVATHDAELAARMGRVIRLEDDVLRLRRVS
jgi:ATP-binding cassette, subfamily C, bacterial CydD